MIADETKYLIYVKVTPPTRTSPPLFICKIEQATQDDERLDGFHQMLSDGKGQFFYRVFSGLEQTLLKSGFVLEAIDTSDLTDEERSTLREIANKYIWIPSRGYLRKDNTQ